MPKKRRLPPDEFSRRLAEERCFEPTALTRADRPQSWDRAIEVSPKMLYGRIAIPSPYESVRAHSRLHDEFIRMVDAAQKRRAK